MITHRVRGIYELISEQGGKIETTRVKVQRKSRLITALLQNVNLRWMTWKKSTWLLSRDIKYDVGRPAGRQFGNIY